jgi:endonuclease YncB( thermonuclease family)
MKKWFTYICTTVVVFSFVTITDVYAKGKGSSTGYRSYKSAKAIDGDTYRYKGDRYRVRQYNAPELGKPGSQKATRSRYHLEAL